MVLLGTSIVAGIAAGLFGIGGGAIIVPALYFVFVAMGHEQTAMHAALATSLATMILTSTRSVLGHHKHGAVDWAVLKSWSPWIVFGAFAGQATASGLTGSQLAVVFAILAYILSAQLFFGRPDWRLGDDLPRGPLRAAIGGAIGTLSSLMGIGGGVFGVTLMTVYGRAMQQAVGTAAGFGLVIGLPGAMTAAVAGYGADGLPPFSLGYVNLVALAFISTITVAMAPLGVKLAHSLDGPMLKRLFAFLLFAVATRILFGSMA
nr:sulfite exporter TauE/SafE family protein [Erythrobacter ani]